MNNTFKMYVYVIIYVQLKQNIVIKQVENSIFTFSSLADQGGWAHPARAPPNGRGPMIFFMPKTLNILNIFFARFARDTL